MSSSSSREEKKQYVHSSSLTPHDVLSGRGPRIQNHPGNQLFRTIVASRQYDYTNAARHKDKQIIAREIVAYVRGRAGMRYSLGSGRRGSATGASSSGGGGEKGDVVHAVEGMVNGLQPGGRFLELVVVGEPNKSAKKGGGGGGSSKKKSTSSSSSGSGTASGGKKRSKPTSYSHGGKEEEEEQAVIVAHPDLWRLVDDDAACEKVKQAFRNLSKGLISDPKVKSAYGGGGNTENGEKGRSRSRSGGGKKGGKRKGGAKGDGGERGGRGGGAKGKRGGGASRHSSSSSTAEITAVASSTDMEPDTAAGPLHLQNLPVAPYPPISAHPPEQHHGLSSAAAAAALDLDLDDLVNDFGSIEELAQSLELLESGAADIGVGGNSSSDGIRQQQARIPQEQTRHPYQEVALNDAARGTVHNPLLTHAASAATATATAAMYSDLEPNANPRQCSNCRAVAPGIIPCCFRTINTSDDIAIIFIVIIVNRSSQGAAYTAAMS